jgi:2-dehydrotetronate isomerase
MPKFAANLTMMFTEWSFLDRFDAAADSGFTAVEYLFPYEHPPEAIGARLSKNGLTQALFNLPPGDWPAGERGLAALPGRLDEIMAGTERALAYAEATGVKQLHLMSGLREPGDAAGATAYRRAVAATAELASICCSNR